MTEPLTEADLLEAILDKTLERRTEPAKALPFAVEAR